MQKHLLFIISFLIFSSTGLTQKITIIQNQPGISIRGLSVVDDNVVWVSGSNGSIGKSINGGKTWEWTAIKGFSKNDFRDIEAFDDMNAVVMAVGEPAYILRTVDGGTNWNIVFKDTTKGMFLDAMEFWNEESGIVIGDPINHHFFIARTFDGGRSWRVIPEANLPSSADGEACFASSGTNVRKLNKKEAIFISGGIASNLFIRDKKINIPIQQGSESKGANSIAIKNKSTFIVVGGDYKEINSTEKNCAISFDGGNSWQNAETPPNGYRSCIEYIRKNEWVTCGMNGVDYTKDDGKTFYSISKEGFHVCRKAKNGKAIFLAGSDGRIGMLE
jgi:photosystem II stability/assembly factor-like uncharacterized protein